MTGSAPKRTILNPFSSSCGVRGVSRLDLVRGCLGDYRRTGEANDGIEKRYDHSTERCPQEPVQKPPARLRCLPFHSR